MLRIFGVLDIIAAISLVFVSWGFGNNVALIFAVYLIIKGLLFLTSFISWLDLMMGVVIILAVFGYVGIISWISFVLLIQKGFFSLLI